jgi:hypothetical protein
MNVNSELEDGDAAKPENEFQRLSKEKPQSLLAEFVGFLWQDKKWWLLPIVVVLLVISLFIVLTNSVVGPFIYVFF